MNQQKNMWRYNKEWNLVSGIPNMLYKNKRKKNYHNASLFPVQSTVKIKNKTIKCLIKFKQTNFILKKLFFISFVIIIFN